MFGKRFTKPPQRWPGGGPCVGEDLGGEEKRRGGKTTTPEHGDTVCLFLRTLPGKFSPQGEATLQGKSVRSPLPGRITRSSDLRGKPIPRRKADYFGEQ